MISIEKSDNEKRRERRQMTNFRRFHHGSRLPRGKRDGKADTTRDGIGREDSFFKTSKRVGVFFAFDRGCCDCYQLSVLLKPRLDFHASHREVAGPNGVGDDRMRFVS